MVKFNLARNWESILAAKWSVRSRGYRLNAAVPIDLNGDVVPGILTVAHESTTREINDDNGKRGHERNTWASVTEAPCTQLIVRCTRF